MNPWYSLALAATVLLTADLPAQTTSKLETVRLTTTHENVFLRFEFNPEVLPCSGPCGSYYLWLNYERKSTPEQLPGAEWSAIASSSCLEVLHSAGAGANDFLCAITRRLAGRDKRDADYVIFRMHSSYAQLKAIEADAGVRFSIGAVRFALTPESRKAMRDWLDRTRPAVASR